MARKGIYEYTIGGEKRYADPYEMHVKMEEASGGQLSTWIVNIQQADDTKNDKARQSVSHIRNEIVNITRFAFNLPPIDHVAENVGYTWHEVYELAIHFLAWRQTQKKSGVKSPSTCISSRESDSTKPSEFMELPNHTIQSGSASFSTDRQSVQQTQCQ